MDLPLLTQRTGVCAVIEPLSAEMAGGNNPVSRMWDDHRKRNTTVLSSTMIKMTIL